jgi:hypothetical protein
VQAMLSDCPTPPKLFLDWERDGRQYKVLQYGECVIGHAFYYIEKHKGVVEKIRAHCQEDLAGCLLARDQMFEVIAETALEFNDEARFTVDGNGELTIDLDMEKARARVRRGLAEKQETNTTPVGK